MRRPWGGGNTDLQGTERPVWLQHGTTGKSHRMRLQEKDLLGPAGDADSAKKTRQTNFDATHRLVYAQFQSGSPGAVTRQGSAARRHAS